MNKRISSLFLAFLVIFSLGISLRAFKIGIPDIIEAAENYDTSANPSYNLSAWNALSSAERSSTLESLIISHGGTPTLKPDFADSDEAYNVYCKLSGNGLDRLSPSSALIGKGKLESSGNADFGLGFYRDDGHTSGSYGEGSVADQLNTDLLNYVRNQSGSGSDPYTIWIVGDYTVRPFFRYSSDKVLNTLCIFDRNNKMVGDLGGPNIFTSQDKCEETVLSARFYDFTVNTSTGDYSFFCDWYYYSNGGGLVHWPLSGNASCFKTSTTVIETEVDPDSIPAIGIDDNGNTIDLNLSPNYVTYQGDKYNYNSDNSVTVGGTTYYINVNPSDLPDNYYQDFIDHIINLYNNYYFTEENTFDDTDILAALKSIFDSLESFRSNVYTYLKLILDKNFNFSINLSPVVNKLNEILSYLKTIKFSIDEISADKTEEFNAKWLELIAVVKDKFQVDQISANVDNCVSALFADVSYDSGTLVATYSYDSGSSSEDTVVMSGSFLPSIHFTFLGTEYNLLSSIPSIAPSIQPIKDIISAILIIQFIFSLFRSLPSIIGGVSGLISSSPEVEVSLYRSKYDH